MESEHFDRRQLNLGRRRPADTEADSGRPEAGDANCISDQVCLLGYRDGCQMSIFSAISIASSTSMPGARLPSGAAWYALTPDIVTGISYPAKNSLGIYLNRYRQMNAKQESGFEVPAFRASIARDVAPVRINRDGEEVVVVALEEIRLDSGGVGLHSECPQGRTEVLRSVPG